MTRDSESIADTQISKARSYAFYLLKFRNRSQGEIEEKLIKKNFSSDIIGQTVDYLKKYRFIDDARFTRDWIKARLNKPFGLKRIVFELKTKGIAPELIKDAVDKAKESFPEAEVVLSLARKQAKKYGNIDTNKIKQRVFGYLSRRGFNINIIEQAIKKL